MNNYTIFISIISALAALVAAIGTIINIKRIREVKTEVKDVHIEVKTANSLSIAELADAVETRRIDKIPKAEQTAGEKTHVIEVPGVK